MILGQCISFSNSPMTVNSPFFNFDASLKKKCMAISSPINGQISYSTAESNGYVSGTIATLICQPGLF